jgi:hypothetical protein
MSIHHMVATDYYGTPFYEHGILCDNVEQAKCR